MSVKKKLCFQSKSCQKRDLTTSVSESPASTLPLQKPTCEHCKLCEVEVSLINYYVKIKGVQDESIQTWTNDLVKQLIEDKRADRKIRMQANLSMELKASKTKRFLLFGSFWIGTFFGLFYLLIYSASSNINWGILIAVFSFLPIFFIILGAFILKSMDSLKEENFMKLVRLTLGLHFKVIRSLIKRKK
jgi:hypothetical protein